MTQTDGTFEKGHYVKLDDGSLVERDVLNIVERVYEYDSNLKVQYLEWAGKLGEPPYRIMELCRDNVWRTVFGVWKLDETVLERLYAADHLNHDILAKIDTQNAMVRKGLKRRYEERMESAADMVEHYLKSPKGRYSIRDEVTGKKITLDDQEGVPAKVEESE